MAELGYLPACRMLMTLLQCIKSARWPDDNPLSILPGIELDQPKHKALPETLVALSSLPGGAVTSLTKDLKLPGNTATQFTKAASLLPQLSLSISKTSSTGITISLTRRKHHPDPEFRIFAPKFPKPQTEGYFLVVTTVKSDGSDGDLLALKRVSWPPVNRNGSDSGSGSSSTAKGGNKHNNANNNKNGNAHPSVRSSVKFPEALLEQYFTSSDSGSAGKVNIRVISDSYLGMEWTLSNVEVQLMLDKGKQKEKEKEIETQTVPEGAGFPVKGWA